MSRGRVRGPLLDFVTALQFLTRLPVRLPEYRPDGLARAVAYFPLVGLMVGALAAGVDLLLRPRLSPLAAAVATVALLVVLTGCLHEDGLADVADAFGGGWGREQILAILKDSRIGSYGAAALGLTLLARVALLAALPPHRIAGTLVAAHVLCRWTTLPLSHFLPAARAGDAGQGARIAGLTSRSALVAGSAMMLALVSVALRMRAVPAVSGALLLTWLGGLYFSRRIGGVTGDCFGAINQLTEVWVYVCGVWMI